MSGYTLFALLGAAVLAGWVVYVIRTEDIPGHVARALADAEAGFCEWADATLAVFDDEDDETFTERCRAIAAAQAAEIGQ